MSDFQLRSSDLTERERTDGRCRIEIKFATWRQDREGSDRYSDRCRIADKRERGDCAKYDADDQSFTVAEQHQ